MNNSRFQFELNCLHLILKKFYKYDYKSNTLLLEKRTDPDPNACQGRERLKGAEGTVKQNPMKLGGEAIRLGCCGYVL